ncbi:MAG: cytochrome C biogenesis protein, partial [Bacteroidota bacterium]
RDKQKWLTAIEKDSLTWDHLNDLKYPDGDAIFIYNISEIPDNILIDSKGKILARSLRSDTLVNTMKTLFERED